MDIKEVSPEFQKLNKSDKCIIIHMRNDSKVTLTTQVSPLNWFPSHFLKKISIKTSTAIIDDWNF